MNQRVRLKLMEGDRRPFVLYVASIYFLLCCGSCSVIVEGPSNVTALTGSDASFLCTVAAGWKSLSWIFNGVFAVSITSTSGAVVDSNQITVRNSTNIITGEFTSEMTVRNVNYSNSGMVQCQSLSSEPKEAFLSVQVNGSLKITNGSLTVPSNITIDLFCTFLKWYPMPRITWEINNTLASSLDYVVDFVTGKDGLVNGTSVLTLRPQDKVTVTCLASIETLPKPQSTSVEIVVKENISGAKTDNTKIIIIAVTVSVGCLLLLIIIVVVVVCCCKKKKKGTGERSFGGRYHYILGISIPRSNLEDYFGKSISCNGTEAFMQNSYRKIHYSAGAEEGHKEALSYHTEIIL
ncbi:immunoglobulin superfamily member 5 [Spea bombifrons]|uniref:immunoglobulin superfamily member 5 n=1 Tax=Spea bombifrons TaxID=233779 RepID=UPI00234B28E2|nr:immunoglobulin superfamily member 5 [Spea bombifrons]